MSGLSEKLVELGEIYDGGETRYWINDAIEFEGVLTYHDVVPRSSPVCGYVGLVDDDEGGMVAFGPLKELERLAARLNKLHVVEELMHS